ncbi:MAG: dihydroorotase family protein [Candidatus Micrarchaeota archaeon]
MIIKNGTIVNSAGVRKADVYCELGRIRRIKPHIPIRGKEEVIDATGCFVLPGMIDAHVHLRDFREVMKEDFFTGTSAALAGGVTSIIDMPNNSLATISLQALEAKKLVASRKALCNYGFHFGATNTNFEDAMDAAKDSSVAGLKIYMGSSTGSLLVDDYGAFYKHLQQFKKPIVLHAEDEHAIRHFSHEHEAKDATSHNKIRNETVAELAVSRAISTAGKTNAKIHIAHISTKKEVELISKAKRAKMHITCEVTPHHLLLDETLTKKMGNFAKVNPPLRGKKEIAYLWSALKSGKIDIIATDHAPHLKEDKEKPYIDAPSGMPELDTALLLMLDAVVKKKLLLTQLVQLYSSMPAKIFNIRNKGELAVGNDADLVIVNLKEKTKITAEKLFTKCKWSPYEGLGVNASIRKTILGGKIAFDGESIIARIGEGKQLKFG